MVKLISMPTGHKWTETKTDDERTWRFVCSCGAVFMAAVTEGDDITTKLYPGKGVCAQ